MEGSYLGQTFDEVTGHTLSAFIVIQRCWSTLNEAQSQFRVRVGEVATGVGTATLGPTLRGGNECLTGRTQVDEFPFAR